MPAEYTPGDIVTLYPFPDRLYEIVAGPDSRGQYVLRNPEGMFTVRTSEHLRLVDTTPASDAEFERDLAGIIERIEMLENCDRQARDTMRGVHDRLNNAEATILGHTKALQNNTASINKLIDWKRS